MDLWVVAAAAGAGYLAKYWNRLSKNSDSSSQLSLSSGDSKFENTESPNHPFRQQAWRDKLGKGVSSDLNSLNGLLNLPLPISPNENSKDVVDENERSSNTGGNCCFQFSESSAEVASKQHSAGNKTSIRTRHSNGHFSRPVNSLESCLMAQLCREHAKMEEYVISSLSSPSTATRPFLVSDGSRIISRKGTDSYGASIQSQEYKLRMKDLCEKDGNVFGVPCLPRIGSLEDPKKMKLKPGRKRSGRLNSSNNVFCGKHIRTKHDAMFVFSLGISFGIITSMMANKREVDNLRDLLKQTESLVQDLHEELEMKDAVTVKELNNENYGSQDTCDHSFYEKELNVFSPEKHMDNSPRNDMKELYYPREEESSGSMSKIEAELEAELERLGLNMNSSSMDRKLSELVELDSDFEADFAQGELRTDLTGGEAFAHSKSNEAANEICTSLPGPYAVSPRELSLRLHEVIQSRLEARVKELEIALENSQMKVEMVQSEHALRSYGQASHFTRECSFTSDDCDHPLVMNLSGEALDAYNEAYEELIKRDESDEDSPSIFHGSDHEEGSHSNGSVIYSTYNGEKRSRDIASSKVVMLEGQSSGVSKLNVVTTGDENSGFDCEMERQLIRRIVERTKKGSPVFQNAQKILYSMDEDEF